MTNVIGRMQVHADGRATHGELSPVASHLRFLAFCISSFSFSHFYCSNAAKLLLNLIDPWRLGHHDGNLVCGLPPRTIHHQQLLPRRIERSLPPVETRDGGSARASARSACPACRAARPIRPRSGASRRWAPSVFGPQCDRESATSTSRRPLPADPATPPPRNRTASIPPLRPPARSNTSRPARTPAQ